MDDSEPKALVKVLFVDDEENILKSLKRLLGQEDEMEVLTAVSGEEGLKLLNSTENIGLIVSDQRMPGMSGAQFLEKAKDLLPDTLRIILTGYADLNATMDAINKGGAFRYITKPWDDDEIIRIIRDAVSRYSLLRENKRLTALVNQQNEELQKWNANLKRRVLDQTGDIRKKSEELEAANRKLKKSFEHTILAFSSLIELRDKKVRDHSRNVADLVVNVARKANLDDQVVQLMKTAALLHDIGKIGISDGMLLKDINALNENERDEYILHPIRGQAAIDLIEDLREVGILIRHHHECFDGSGFPDRLKRDEIPLGSRIIAMADFIDRTIRKLQDQDALEMTIRKTSKLLGANFDPDLFPLFKDCIAETQSLRGTLLQKRGMVEREMEPQSLQEGMVILRSVYSGTGLLLISKGTRLDESAIRGIMRYYRIDPPSEPLLVLAQP